MLPQVARAYDFMVDGLCYNYNSDGTSVTVTYEGTGANGYGYSNLNGDLVIPPSVTYDGTTYSVTTIGYLAFYGCSGLTSVTIPNSVTTIGDVAFDGCTGLTSVTIPNSVTSIGNYAFASCSGLTSIVVENGNPKYDSRNNCNAIIETESNALLVGCKSTIIPNSVTTIGSGAFQYCSGLTSVTIPNSVTAIGTLAFAGCTGLTSIVVENGNPKYDSRNNCNAIIKTESNTLIAGCKNTIIPNSVTTIGDQAFLGCTGLTEVTIPNSVTTIGEGAFYGCTGLTSVTIGNSVTSIGNYAFAGCTGLTSIKSKILNPDKVTMYS